MGTTGGSVIDNLEGRLFAEYGVDVDSAKYAESVIKLEVRRLNEGTTTKRRNATYLQPA